MKQMFLAMVSTQNAMSWYITELYANDMVGIQTEEFTSLIQPKKSKKAKHALIEECIHCGRVECFTVCFS